MLENNATELDSFSQDKELTRPVIYAEDKDEVQEVIPNEEYFRNCLAECFNEALTSPNVKINKQSSAFGELEFRQAIASFLLRFRKLSVDPEQIIVSSGIERLLFNILSLQSVVNASKNKKIGLLSRAEGIKEVIQPRVAISESEAKLAKPLFSAANIKVKEIADDDVGITLDSLITSGTTLLYVTPMDISEYALDNPADRQKELIEWANSASYRYIIEYDYEPEQEQVDSFKKHDTQDKVIYMNSFSTLLCKGTNTSWVVLPKNVCKEYKEHYEKFGCPVCTLEQEVFTLFLNKGHLDSYLKKT